MSKQNIQNPAARQPSTLRRWLPIGLGAAAGLCFLIALVIGLLFYLNPLDSVAAVPRPLVLVHSPGDGDRVVAGEYVSIHAVARDEENILRVELWIDDVLEDVQTSNLENGTSPFPFLSDWLAAGVGSHTLAVRAFNSVGARSHVSINIEVVPSDDRDGDGAVDAADSCPDDPGPASDDGCPIPGDADGDEVPDGEDECPGVPGLPDDAGCPDRDGDGVPDHLDAEPDEPGPADTDGAPDTDGDGVADDEDLAPEEPGPADGGGAPESDAGDRDSDGAADDVDPCPDDPGEPEDGFCPPPGDDPAPGAEEGGSLFDDPPGFFEDNDEIPVTLEIEAYEFGVSDEFTNVWCYLRLNDEDIRRYEFDPEGENYWNIAELLSGENSIRLVNPIEEPLDVFLDCWAESMHFYEDDDGEGIGDAGAWGSVFDLGTYSFSHGSEDWGGRELVGYGTGPDDHAFWARYRICSPTCDETAIQPPILDPPSFGPRGDGPFTIRWRWDGNEDLLEGFELRVNSTYYYTLRGIPADRRSLDIADFQPTCGEDLEFQIIAIGRDLTNSTIWRSPPSNSRFWYGGTCPRTVMVSFTALETSGMGSEHGPISGTFFANDSILIADYKDGPPSFDATDDTYNRDRDHIRYLRYGNTYPIQLLFDEIESDAMSCIGMPSSCTGNYAPSVNFLEVDLGPRETLTIGARISEPGSVGNVFDATISIPPGEIVPGPYYVHDNGIQLIVMVDVLVGPEAGSEPDLIIQEVFTEEEGAQPQIRVFNNAADLIDEIVEVSIVQLSTGEEIGRTSAYLTIPSGASALLPTGMEIAPYDLRLIMDPENTITETAAGEHNNEYETPVLIQVQFTHFDSGAGPCETFGAQVAEFRFRMKIGHRPPGGVVNWVWNNRYPEAGEVSYNFRTGEYTNHTWEVGDDPEYFFEFEIPAEDSLVIWGDGTEDDAGLGADDYAGSFMETYGPEVNYGSQPEGHISISSGYLSCPDGPSLGWGSEEDGIGMIYIITRVH